MKFTHNGSLDGTSVHCHVALPTGKNLKLRNSKYICYRGGEAIKWSDIS